MQMFTGFFPETIDFLWEIRMNNNKEWMDQNRERYREVLKNPFDHFAVDVAEKFEDSTKEKLGWAVSRINRDIRYSKDKSPYRACRWVVFKEPAAGGTTWKARPTFYFELTPEGYTHGMGFYEATPAYMKAFRKKIETRPEVFCDIIRGIEKKGKFVLVGEDYKKVDPSGLPLEISNWYVKKSFALIETKQIEGIIFKRDLCQKLVEDWKDLIPLYRYLKEIKID